MVEKAFAQAVLDRAQRARHEQLGLCNMRSQHGGRFDEHERGSTWLLKTCCASVASTLAAACAPLPGVTTRRLLGPASNEKAFIRAGGKGTDTLELAAVCRAFSRILAMMCWTGCLMSGLN